ncbi:MAG TPA: hypothetical protein VHA52_05215, partial [Candidatus Babeliaceae bacterium]|nr:hypothetical protein [Candidatus Babeliaceae bacterium]
VVHNSKAVSDHLIGFNFPDYNITPFMDHTNSSFGTINEVLPLLYLIMRCIVDLKLSSINLYGFSAGGAAIINALAVLNQTIYDQSLKKIGISSIIKKRMIRALEHGLIVLDCPLKSVEEVIEIRGSSPDLEMIAARHIANNMRPIDALFLLKGLRLNIILSFQVPDHTINNRDDTIFINRLRKVNKHGLNHIVIAHDGGHSSFHTTLWNYYKKVRATREYKQLIMELNHNFQKSPDFSATAYQTHDNLNLMNLDHEEK